MQKWPPSCYSNIALILAKYELIFWMQKYVQQECKNNISFVLKLKCIKSFQWPKIYEPFSLTIMQVIIT